MEILQGFAMALADSVPGVSGGTIAFLLGFFDRLIVSLNAIADRDIAARRAAHRFLLTLGAGWAVGMALAMTVLTGLFQSHVYAVSSLFLGFVLASIPAVAWKERAELRGRPRAAFLFPIGFLLVFLITRFSTQTLFELNLTHMTLVSGSILFVAAAAAASVMILPGISGSSLLMAFGLYLPVISQLSALMHGDLSALLPACVFGLGALTGLIFFVRLLKRALKNYRAQTLYFVLGMMAASLYAVVLGPTTLENAQPALSLATFQPIFFLLGCALIALISFGEARRERSL